MQRMQRIGAKLRPVNRLRRKNALHPFSRVQRKGVPTVSQGSTLAPPPPTSAPLTTLPDWRGRSAHPVPRYPRASFCNRSCGVACGWQDGKTSIANLWGDVILPLPAGGLCPSAVRELLRCNAPYFRTHCRSFPPCSGWPHPATCRQSGGRCLAPGIPGSAFATPDRLP